MAMLVHYLMHEDDDRTMFMRNDDLLRREDHGSNGTEMFETDWNIIIASVTRAIACDAFSQIPRRMKRTTQR